MYLRQMVLGLLVAACAALPAQANMTVCQDETAGSEEIVKACTSIIEANRVGKKELAKAYRYRAKAHSFLDELGGEQWVDIDQAIELDPDNAEHYMVRYEMRKKSSHDAYSQEEDLNRAVELDPKNPKYREARAVFFRDEEKYKEALEDATFLRTLDRGKLDYIHLRGDIHSRAGNTDEAIKDLTAAAHLLEKLRREGSREGSLEEVFIYGARGYNHFNKGEYAQAVEDLSRAIAAGRYGVLYQMRGKAFMAQKQYYLAIEDFSEAIKRDAKETYNYHLRSEAYRKLGQHKRALKDATDATYFTAGLKTPKKK